MRDFSQKTFLWVAAVVVVLLLLHLLPPITIGDVTLREVNLLSDLSDAPQADQGGIIPLAKPVVAPAPDSVQNSKYAHISWPKGVEPIEDFSAGAAGGMDHFYQMLDTLRSKSDIGRPVRIAYYGDSFIEGDILVEYLREMLQAKFGGYGVGWLDAGNGLNQYKQTIETHSSGMTEFMAMKSGGYNAQQAGIAERYYQASAGANMTFRSRPTLSATAKGSDGKPLLEFPHTQKWQSARVYLRTAAPVSLQMNVTGGTPETRTLQASEKVQMAETRQWMNNVSVGLSAVATLFGIALETDNGIVVDNFSMRGSSGITLSNLSSQMLAEFNALRPYDLVIIQFGTNAISANSGEKHLKWYMEQMDKVVELFKKGYPETSILVMSTPDRGARTAQGVGTMKNIEALVSYQRQLAAQHRVAFYSLFNAMGGSGSMAKFCEQGMGSKDYIHINHKAGQMIAKHIFDSFVAAIEPQEKNKGS